MMNLYAKIRAKLYREATHLYRDLRHVLGLNNSFYQNARGSRILIYHGICRKEHTRFSPIFLTAETFEAHLKLYKKYFNVVSLDDFYAHRFSDDKFTICITFDDGMANNYKYVLPLLEKYRLPATFFITAVADAGHNILWDHFLSIAGAYGPGTLHFKNIPYTKNKHHQYVTSEGISLKDVLKAGGFEEKEKLMAFLHELVPFKKNKNEEDYWLQMTKVQIRELAASPYAHVGAHGYYHNDLAKISSDDAYTEIVNTKNYLESLTGQPVKSLAFPFGSYTPQVIAGAKKAGYEQLLAMDFCDNNDAADTNMRERFTVNPFISPVNQLYATINRKYE
jgi:peptidoglycan/xylan/chitin deacetylase (PgdA/CDA1 family)